MTEKKQMLESLASKLSKYLSPQIYKSIFSGEKNVEVASQRKKLTIFFSDIAGFTETTDILESEELTILLNQYLREMSSIALEHGATIDKFIGDAIMLFFGDPETRGTERGRRSPASRWRSRCSNACGICRPSGASAARSTYSSCASGSTPAFARSVTSAATTASTTRSSATR